MLRQILAAGFALFVASPAVADPIVVNQWYLFGFSGVGGNLEAGASALSGVNPASIPAPNAPWTFTLAAPGTLILTDAYLAGDTFSLEDFGNPIGSTSVPGIGGCGNDITVCLADTNMSKGSFALAAGNHSISGIVTVNPFLGGAGFFQVQAFVQPGVPEPAAWAVMLGGFALTGGLLRRRQRAFRESVRGV